MMSHILEFLSLRIAAALVGAVSTAHAGTRPGHLSRLHLAFASLFLILAIPAASLLALPAGAGDLDPSFGTNGLVAADLGDSDEARALAIQRDGKIVAAGMTYVYAGERIDFALVRFKIDGSLDETFGDGGVVRTGFGATDMANAIVLQADKIMVAGSSSAYPNSNFALARYDMSGQLDPSFGDGGIVVTGFGGRDRATDLAIQPDGKIVAAGSSCVGETCSIALARYHTDGSPDQSFGDEGKVTTLVGRQSGAESVVLQGDGKIVVAGYADLGDPEKAVVALVRYQPDGYLDPEFGEGGTVTTDFGGAYDHAYAMIVQHDRKLVVAGSAGTLPNTDFMLARYSPDGSLDPAFGNGGKVTTDLFGYDDFARAIVQQPDGKLIVAGVASPTSSSHDFALARYTSTGELDIGFGSAGLTATDVGYSNFCFAAALQWDGRIVVAGRGGDNFVLARYLNDVPGVLSTWLPILTR